MTSIDLARGHSSARAWSGPPLIGIDARLLAMLLVLVAIWLVLNLSTGGIFLSARNLFNLSLQVAVVGVMATGMVLVIVSRNIDLSVGSVLGFVGVFGALLADRVSRPRPRLHVVGDEPAHARRRHADRRGAGRDRRLWRRARPSS